MGKSLASVIQRLLAWKIDGIEDPNDLPETLPDGRVTAEWKVALLSGYDHYWSLHKVEQEWAKIGCPVCRRKSEWFAQVLSDDYEFPTDGD